MLYLEDMLEALQRLRQYLAGHDALSLAADQRTMDAVVRNLEVLGEACKQVPEAIRRLAPEIDWRKIAGMRDILAHAYFCVDSAIVWDAAANKAPQLEAPVRRLLGLPRECSPRAGSRPPAQA